MTAPDVASTTPPTTPPTAPVTTPPSAVQLAGWREVVRLVLRRDRVRLPVWLLSISGLVWFQAVGIVELYGDDPEALARAGELLASNAAFVAMAGPPRALDTVGGRTAFEIAVFAMVLAGLMNLFLVTRHLRAEEESGRAELVRSAMVGRHAAIVAVLLVALAADVVLAVLSAALLIRTGLPSAGSWALGAAIGGAGLVFGGIAAVTSQVTVSTRAASGLAGASIGAAFLLRAVGDVGSGALSWLSPVGWGQALRPYAGERWWPLALVVGAAVGLALAAFAIGNHRDFGAGLLADRPGPGRAAPRLLSPLGLAVRLHRPVVLAWAAGTFLFGVAYGSLGSDVEELLADNELMRQIAAQGGGDVVDSFLATTVLTLALIVGGYAVQGTLRTRGEEQGGRLEPLLATAVSRWRWARSHVLVAAASSVLVLLVTGLGVGLAFGLSTGDLGEAPRIVGAQLAYVPALLVVVGATFALQGALPRLAAASWALLATWLVAGMLGEALRLPAWLLAASPFDAVPDLPAAPLRWAPLLVLTAIAAVLVALGALGFQRRDVAT